MIECTLECIILESEAPLRSTSNPTFLPSILSLLPHGLQRFMLLLRELRHMFTFYHLSDLRLDPCYCTIAMTTLNRHEMATMMIDSGVDDDGSKDDEDGDD